MELRKLKNVFFVSTFVQLCSALMQDKLQSHMPVHFAQMRRCFRQLLLRGEPVLLVSLNSSTRIYMLLFIEINEKFMLYEIRQLSESFFKTRLFSPSDNTKK